MSLRHPSPITRRLLKIASFGLAGLLAGLLTGCTSNPAAGLLPLPNDTDWQTSSTYASATAPFTPRGVSHASRTPSCNACNLRPAATHSHPSSHRTM
jgi:hypothetical protein